MRYNFFLCHRDLYSARRRKRRVVPLVTVCGEWLELGGETKFVGTIWEPWWWYFLLRHAVNPSMGALGSGVLLRSTESIPGLVPRTSCSRRSQEEVPPPRLD